MSDANAGAPRVVIAGAGPVGLSVAFGLARQGVTSLVLEKAAAPAPFARAGVLLPRTLEIFHAWGILEAIKRECIAPDRLDVCDAATGRMLTQLDFAVLSGETLEPGPVFLAQQRTEAILLASLRSSGFSEVRFAHEVTGLRQSDDDVAVMVRPTDGDPYTIRTPFLVGADGAGSAVRSALGLKLEGETYAARVMLAVVRIDDARDKQPWPRLRFDATEYLAALRFAPNQWRVIAALRAGESDSEALAPAAIARRVAATLGDGPFDTEWASTFAIHRRHAPRFAIGRVLLAGDAAHLNSPVGAQGLNAGIADAQNAAWKIARALRGGDRAALIASYDIERRQAIVRGTERFTDPTTKAVLRSEKSLRRILIAAGAFVARYKPLRRRALRVAMMLAFRYGRSPLLEGRGKALGARAPDPDLAASECATLVHYGYAPGELEALPLPEGVRLAPLDAAHAARWRLRPPFAALVRPDGYVGWIERRASPEAIGRHVRRALGYPPSTKEGKALDAKARGR